MARTSALCQLLLVTCCLSLVVVSAMPSKSRDSSESFKEEARNVETSMEAGGCLTGACQPIGCPTGGCPTARCGPEGCPEESILKNPNLESEASQEAEPADERAGTSAEQIEETGSEYEDPSTGTACVDAACRNAAAARRPTPCTSPTCTPTATAGATRATPHRKPATRRPSHATADPAPPAPCPTCKTTTTCTNCPTTTCTTPGCKTA